MNQAHPDKHIPDAACTESRLPLLCVSGRKTEVEVQLGSGSSIEEAAVVVGVEGAAAEVEKATLSNLLKYWLKVLTLSSSPSTDWEFFSLYPVMVLMPLHTSLVLLFLSCLSTFFLYSTLARCSVFLSSRCTFLCLSPSPFWVPSFSGWIVQRGPKSRRMDVYGCQLLFSILKKLYRNYVFFTITSSVFSIRDLTETFAYQSPWFQSSRAESWE